MTKEQRLIEKLVKIIQTMRPNVNIEISELFEEEFRDIVIRAIVSKKREEEALEKCIDIIFKETED